MSSKPWSEKYRPSKISEIVGQEKSLEELEKGVKEFKKGNKAFLLHGPPGNGKTASVYALANDLDYEVLEMNASDFRTKDKINSKIGSAVNQQSLLGKKSKIILVDELDGIHGNSDRGGVPAISEVISKSSFPVVLIANDPWAQKLRSLRTKCKLVKFGKVDIRSQVKRLREISEKEGVKAEDTILHEIAKQAEGDLRAAINDFQSIGEGREKISNKDLETISDREKMQDIFQTLLAIFKSKDKNLITKAFYNSDKSPDEILMWLVENIPKEYEKAEEIASAYDMLSRADVFRGRIIHNQAWTLQSFSNELMSLGVAHSKKEKYHKFTRYSPPSTLIKMGRSKMARALRNQVAGVIGEHCHCSKKRAVKQFPYLSIILKKQGLDLELGEEAQDYLKKYSA